MEIVNEKKKGYKENNKKKTAARFKIYSLSTTCEEAVPRSRQQYVGGNFEVRKFIFLSDYFVMMACFKVELQFLSC